MTMAHYNNWTEKDIFDFLYFGFIPRFVNKYIDIYHNLQQKDCEDENTRTESAEYYIKRGERELNNIFDRALESIDSKSDYLILLSGGLDSRAILGGLLDRVDSKQIQTVTFGTPGTWDFEIGRNVAKQAGVRNFAIDLTNPEWKWEENALIETARRMEQPVQLFDSYVNQKIPEIFGEDFSYWVGFLGGTSTQPYHGTLSWDASKEIFSKGKKFVRSTNITPEFYKPVESLPIQPFCDSEILSFEDQLHFLRQNLLTRNILFRKNYHYVTPFYDIDWIFFFSKVPTKFRVGYWLYIEILKSTYPQLFSLPVKNNFGFALDTFSFTTYPKRGLLKIKRITNASFPNLYLGVHPNINYIDFDEGLRERVNLRELIEKNLNELIDRNLITWMNIEDIWDLHQKRKANYADALLILTALELHMKAGIKAQP